MRGEAGAVKRRRQPPRKEREDVEDEEEAGRRVGRDRGAGEDEAAMNAGLCFSSP